MNSTVCCAVVLASLTVCATAGPVNAGDARPDQGPSVKARNEAVIASLSCSTKPMSISAHAERTDVASLFNMIGPISGVHFRIVGPRKAVRAIGFHVVNQSLCDVLSMLAVKLDLSFAISPKDGAIEVTVGTDKLEVDLNPIQQSS